MRRAAAVARWARRSTRPASPAAGAATASGARADPKIAMIAKSSTNPVFLSARTGAEAAAKELSQKHGIPIEIDVADAARRGRTGAGAAHRPGGQRGGERRADLLLRCRQGHRRDQRRGRARRAGHDVRQRRAAVEAVRVLRRGRHQDRRGGDGRAGAADGRQGQGRDSCRQPERAQPAQPRRRASRQKPRSIPASRSSTRSITSRRRRTPPPR